MTNRLRCDDWGPLSFRGDPGVPDVRVDGDLIHLPGHFAKSAHDKGYSYDLAFPAARKLWLNVAGLAPDSVVGYAGKRKVLPQRPPTKDGQDLVFGQAVDKVRFAVRGTAGREVVVSKPYGCVDKTPVEKAPQQTTTPKTSGNQQARAITYAADDGDAPCNGKLFTINGTPSTVYQVDVTNGALTSQGTFGSNLSGALALNPADGRLYSIDAANTIWAIDPATKTVVDKFTPTAADGLTWPTSSTTYAGMEFDDDGQMYILAKDATVMRVVDLKPGSSTLGQYARDVAVGKTLPDTDVAYNPADKMLYWIDQASRTVFRTDPANGGATSLGTTSNTMAAIAGLAFDPIGNLYVYSGNAAQFYQVDLTALDNSGLATLGKDNLLADWTDTVGGNSDLAGCVNAEDFGDAPSSYKIKQADSGPSHDYNANVRIGADWDAEPDAAQVNVSYDDGHGDDTADGRDDEDAFKVAPSVDATATSHDLDVPVTNTTGSAVTLAGWIDLDGDGMFDNSTESASVDVPDQATTATLHWDSGPTTTKSTFLRLRLYDDQETAAGPTGAAAGGEVEDWPMTVGAIVEKCPDTAYLTDNSGYLYTFDLTTSAATKVGTAVTGMTQFGFNRLDGQLYGWSTTQPSGTAQRTLTLVDPTNGTAADPVSLLPSLDGTSMPTTVTPTSVAVSPDGTELYLHVYNTSSMYVVNADPGSANYLRFVRTVALKNASTSGAALSGPWQDFAPNPVDGKLYAKHYSSNVVYRIDPVTGVVENLGTVTGYSGSYYAAMFDSSGLFYTESTANTLQVDLANQTDGKVVLGAATVLTKATGPSTIADGAGCFDPIDYGDAPSTYDPSTPAHHPFVTGLTIGSEYDGDLGPTAPLDGTGDNELARDDEDALEVAPSIDATATSFSVDIPVDNSTGADGTLAGWVDFDGSGTFDDGERATVDIPDGTADKVTLSWPSVSVGTTKSTYLRLRLYDRQTDNPSSSGAALGGEVEDWPVTVKATVQKCPDTAYLTDNNGYLYNFDLTTSAATKVGTAVTGVLQFGFNRLDGQLYGWSKTQPSGTAQRTLTLVDPTTGTAASPVSLRPSLDGTSMPSITPTSAAVSPDGKELYLHVYNTSSMYVVNADPGSANYLRFVRTVALKNGSTSGAALSGPWQDFAPNPVDGKLYAKHYNSNVVYRIDPTTGVVENLGTVTGYSGYYLAAMFDSSGLFYAESTANTFRIDLANQTDGKVVLGSTAALTKATGPTSIADGAGCLDPIDRGDAPSTYDTGTPASHPFVTGLTIGSAYDGDLQPTPVLDGTGDDELARDDEDAFTDYPSIDASATSYSLEVPVNNSTGSAGTLAGWVDFDGSGTFDSAERATVDVPDSTSSKVTLSWSGISVSASSSTYLRLRLYEKNTADPSSTGAATGGEVEDWGVTVRSKPAKCTDAAYLTDTTGKLYVLNGDSTTTQVGSASIGTTQFGYNTQDGKLYGWSTTQPSTSTTARTLTVVDPATGTAVDGSPMSLRNSVSGATMPNVTPSAVTISPDGKLLYLQVYNSNTYVINVDPGSPDYLRYVSTFIPTGSTVKTFYNLAMNPQDKMLYGISGTQGLYKIDPSTGAETSLGNVIGGAGTYYGSQFDTAGNLYLAGTSNVLRVDLTGTSPNLTGVVLAKQSGAIGTATVGDGGGCLPAADFSDAPSTYNVSDAPSHLGLGSKLLLGSQIDTDLRSMPDSAGLGDDQTNLADEDGVGSWPTDASGTSYSINVSVTNNTAEPATLAAWVDGNGNGTFDDGELQIAAVAASSGTTTPTLTWTLGRGTKSGHTYARVRLFPGTVDGPSPTGSAEAGEVEDYPVYLVVPGSCPNTHYLTKNVDGKLYGWQPPTTPASLIGTSTVKYDGFGYNAMDGMLYGAVSAASGGGVLGQVVIIDPATGAVTPKTVTANATTGQTLPAAQYQAGVVSPDGETLYLLSHTATTGYTTYSAKMVNVDKDSADYLTYIGETSALAHVHDIAFHPKDNFIYGVDSAGKIYRVNPVTGDQATVGTVSLPSGWGSGYVEGLSFDEDGYLYGWGYGASKVFKIDLTATDPDTGYAVLGSTTATVATTITGVSASASTSDGGSCLPPPLLVEKTADRETTVPGQTVKYTWTIENPSNEDKVDASISDDLSAVLDDADFNPDSLVASAGSVSYDEATKKVTWSKPLVAAKDTYTVTYTVTAKSGGDSTITNQVVASEGNCTLGSPDSRCTTTVQVANIDVAKTVSKKSAIVGDTVTYTVTVTNTSATAEIKGAAFEDDLADVLDDADLSGISSADVGKVEVDEGAQKLAWAGDLPVSGRATITYDMVVKSGGNDSMVNSVGAGYGNCASDSADKSDCTTTVAVVDPSKVCKSYAWLATGAGPTDVYQFNPVTGAMTKVDNTTVSTGYDAMGFSILDGKLYALSIANGSSGTTNTMYKLDPSGTDVPVSITLSGTTMAAGTYSGGGVSVDGSTLYAFWNNPNAGSQSVNGPLYAINLDPNAGTVGAVTALGALSGKLQGVNDWAYHPLDKTLYTLAAGGTYFRITPGTSSSTLTNLGVIASTTARVYSGAFFDTRGTYYYIDQTANPPQIMTVDMTGSTASSLLSKAPSPVQLGTLPAGTVVQDAAGCLKVADFGDAPDTYLTSADADGANHQLTSGLALGTGESTEPDARLNFSTDDSGVLDGTGDTDDALTDTLAIGVADTSFSTTVPYTNTTGSTVTMAGWLDANQDGKFSDDELQRVDLAAGDPSPTLTWPVPSVRPSGTTYLRLRLYDRKVLEPSWSGTYSGGGEVEDYPVTVTSDPYADLQITVDDDNPTVSPGATGTYTFTVTNLGPDATTGTPPASVTLKAPTDTAFDMSDLPTGCTDNGDSTVNCTVSATAMSGTAEFAIPYTVSASASPGDVRTDGLATVSYANDPVDTNNSVSYGITIGASDADLETTATGATDIVPGTTTTISVDVKNVGPSDASSDATVTIALPDNTVVDSTGTMPDGCAAAKDLLSVTCTLSGGLAVEADQSYEIPVKVEGTAPESSTLDGGTASVSSSDDTTNTANNQATFTITTAAASADVEMAKTPSTTQIGPGDKFTYTLTATNNGPSTATKVQIADTLPATLWYVSSTPTGCQYAKPTVTCPTKTLAPNESVTYTMTVRLDPAYTGDGTDVTNSATATTSPTDPEASNNTATAGVPTGSTTDPTADLYVTKTLVSSDQIVPGDTFQYKLAAKSNGPADASNAVVTDTLPDELTFVSSTPVTCRASGQTLTCPTISNQAYNSTQNYTITVKLDPSYTGDGSDITNTASIASDTPDPESSNNTTTAGAPPVGDPVFDLEVSATGATDIVPGTSTTVSVTVKNKGPSSTTNASPVTVTLPDNVTAGDSPPSGCVVVPPGKTKLACEIPAGLAPSKSWTVTIPVDVAADAPESSTLQGGSAKSTTSDSDGGNDEAAFTITTTATSADLSTEKQAVGTEQVAPGNTFEYKITVTNNGPSDATNVVVSDDLPTPLSFVSSEPSGCTASGQAVGCPTIPTLANGDSKTYVLTVRLDPAYSGNGSDIANVATSSSDTTDPDPDNDGSDPASPPGGSTTDPEADLSTSKKAVGDTQVVPGDTFDYEIVVKDNGPSDASDVAVTDDLPDPLTFVSSEPSGCTASGQLVTCPTIATLANGDSKRYVLTVRLTSSYDGTGSDIANVATSDSPTDDPNPDNDGSDPAGVPGDTTADPEADLSTTKAATTSTPVSPGERFAYKITVTNNGPSDATNVAVKDTLPDGLTFVSSDPTGCSATGQDVTCPTIASLANGESASFTLTVELSPSYSGNGSDIENVATSSSDTDDPNPDNDGSDPAGPPGDTTADPKADLSTAKKPVGDKQVVPGDTFDYEIVVTNNGPSDATDVVVTDDLPVPLSFVSSEPSGCTASGQVVTCPTIPALADGDSKTYVLKVKLDSAYTGNGSDIANIATSDSPTDDPDPDNDGSDPAGLPGDTPADAQADLEITATGPTTPVTPGDPATIHVTVKNNGPSTTESPTTVTIPLPDGVTVGDPLPAGCATDEQTVTCTSSASLADGADVSFDIPVTVDSDTPEGVLDSTATLANDEDTNADNNSAPYRIPVGKGSADLSTAKAAVGDTKVSPGQTFDYKITVTNNGPSDATNVVVKDTLPDGLIYQSSDPAGCTASGQDVTCPTVPTLANGASTSYTLTVQLSPSYSGNGSDIQNVATSSSDTTDPVPGNDGSDPAGPPGGTTADPEADLATTKKAVGDTQVVPGDTFDYEIVVTNNGPSDATDVAVTDTLPDPLAFVSSTPTGCSANGQTVTCPTIQTLADGDSKTYVLKVKLAADYTGTGSDIANVATSSSPTADPNPDNDGSDPAGLPGGTTADPEADLSTTKKAVGTTKVAPGDTFDYEIVVTNNGPSDATDVAVMDELPVPLSFMSSTPTGCSASGQTVTCPSIATLANGDSKTYVLKVRLDPAYSGNGSDIANVATSDSPTDDPNPDNDGSDPAGVPGDTTADPEADLSTTKKAVGDTQVVPGETFDYEIVVKNNGPSDATDVAVTDELPTPLTFVSSTPTGCTAVGQKVTCPSIATLANGDSKTYVLKVKLASDYTGNGSDIANVASSDSPIDDPNPDNDGSDPAGLPGGTPSSPQADLEISATGPTSPVTPGDSTTIKVTVKNNGPSATQSPTTVTIPVPDGVTVGDSLPAGCKAAGQSVTCTSTPSLADGADVSFDIPVTVDSDTPEGVLDSTATVANDEDTNADNNSAPYRIPVGKASADLSTTKKAVGTAKVAPGDTFDYEIVVTNNGPSDATDVAVSDELPAPLSFLSSTPTGCTANGRTVTCPTVATLAAGDSKTYVLKVRLDPAYTGDGSDIANVATSTSPTDDPNPDNDGSDPAGVPGDTTADPEADIETTKQATTDTPVAPGESFAYQVTVKNNGPSDASNVVVKDTLPTGLTYQSSDPAGCTAKAQAVTCPTITTLADDDSSSYTLTVQLDPGYTGNGNDIQNVATATAETKDPDKSNNTSAAAGPPGGTVDEPEADLSTTKKAVGDTAVVPGTTFDYEIVVKNDGPSTATDVIVKDTLPTPLSFVSSTPTGCTARKQQVTCPSVPTLAPDASKRYVLKVKLASDYTSNGSDIANVATSDSPTDDPNPDNNGSDPSTGSLPGGPAPADPQNDLAIDATAPKKAVAPGKTGTITVTVTNNGPSTTTGDATVTVKLPDHVTATGTEPGNCTVGSDQATLTCTIPPGIDPGDTVTLPIDVQVAPDVPGGTPLDNGEVSVSTPNDPVSSNNSKPISGITTAALADLATTKQAIGTGPVSPGETFDYQVTVTNSGPSTATNVVVKDTLPTPLSLLSSRPGGCTAKGQRVTCPSIASIAPGKSASYLLKVQLDPNYVGDGTDIANVATASGDQDDPNPDDNTSDPSTGGLPGGAPGPRKVDLSVKATSPVHPVVPGKSTKASVVVVNHGPSALIEDAPLTIALPEKTKAGTGIPSGCKAGQGRLTMTCTAPAGLQPTGTHAASMRSTRTHPASMRSTGAYPEVFGALGIVPMASVAGTSKPFDVPLDIAASAPGNATLIGGLAHIRETHDDDPDDDTSPFTVRTLAPQADLAIDKRMTLPARGTVKPGGTWSYEISVRNDGPSDATNIVVTDDLPAALTLLSATTGCTASGQRVSCQASTMEPGASETIKLDVRLSSSYSGNGSDLVNTATVTSQTTDPDRSNNSANVTGPNVPVVDPPLPRTGAGGLTWWLLAMAGIVVVGMVALIAARRRTR